MFNGFGGLLNASVPLLSYAPRMKHALTMAFVLALAGLAAPANAAPNPCALVTSAEAARALGTPVLPAKPVAGGGNTECRYLNAAQNENVLVQVHDRVSQFPSEMLKTPGVKHVPQVGPKAILIGTTLFMVKHGTYVTIGLFKGPNVTDDAAVIKLAKAAAARM
jgi:hypothetical protein